MSILISGEVVAFIPTLKFSFYKFQKLTKSTIMQPAITPSITCSFEVNLNDWNFQSIGIDSTSKLTSRLTATMVGAEIGVERFPVRRIETVASNIDVDNVDVNSWKMRYHPNDKYVSNLFW